jgi:hypothetical protein
MCIKYSILFFSVIIGLDPIIQSLNAKAYALDSRFHGNKKKNDKKKNKKKDKKNG